MTIDHFLNLYPLANVNIQQGLGGRTCIVVKCDGREYADWFFGSNFEGAMDRFVAVMKEDGLEPAPSVG